MPQPRNPHIGGEQLPLIVPDSNWTPPTELPDLRRHKRIALDIENEDRGLSMGRGSSWPMRGGRISGVALAWEGGAVYAPTDHPDTACLGTDTVARWINDHAQAGVEFVTHHGGHDWGWLRSMWGVRCPPRMLDTEAMSMLVDENRLSYRLDDLCRWRGVPGKDEGKLREAAAAFGYRDPKANMWRMPARFVGAYAEQDAAATLALAASLDVDVVKQDLGDALTLEMDLMPMVLEMRLRGMRVDLDAAQRSIVELRRLRDEALAILSTKLNRRIGMDDIRSARKLEEFFQSECVPFRRTEKTGQGSFQAVWMRRHPHWLPRLVARAEQLEEAASKFLQGFIVDYAHNGRIHPSINQYRGEEGGTRSYRFSYSDPALQQMHSRPFEVGQAIFDVLEPWERQFCVEVKPGLYEVGPSLKKVIRGVFLPEDGELWCAADYSQQEYRLIVHFAVLLGCLRAREAADKYRADPRTDFHNMVAEMTGLERKPAKDTNFAKAFGAGVSKFAQMIGQPEERAQEIMDQYDNEMPFVKQLAQRCQKAADQRGFIRLLDGARSHFDMWELAWSKDGDWFAPRPREAALELAKGRRIRRAFTHKAMNRLIQGSAARQTKLWMRECWREGLLPLLQMHDELDFSVRDRAQGELVAQLGRDVVQLEVPMVVDVEYGRTWGDAELSWEDLPEAA